MELLKNFGFEPILFVGQIVNFLIIFWVLKRFLYKPMLKMLEDRKHAIQEGLKHAEEAQKRLDEAVEKEKEILTKAQQSAKKMLDDAKAERIQMIEATEILTKKQVEKMIADARAQIDFEAKETEKRLASHVSSIAIQYLQKAVGELFSGREQEVVMEKAMKKIKERVD